MIRLLTPQDADWQHIVTDELGAAADLHYLPGYVRTYAERRGGKAYCAMWSDGCGVAIQPFVDFGVEVASTYGYGGPLASPGFDQHAAFAAAYADMLKKIGCRSEFCRLHPLRMAVHGPFLDDIAIAEDKPVICLDLETWHERDMRKGHRAAEARARREGVTVRHGDDLVSFAVMYRSQFERCGWHSKWMINLTMLAELTKAVPAWTVMDAILEGEKISKPIASCLLLHGFGVCYYHYAAGTGRHHDIGAGQLLVCEAIRWAKSEGCKQFYMGGGVTAGVHDSLLAFKQGFAKNKYMLYRYERTFQ